MRTPETSAGVERSSQVRDFPGLKGLCFSEKLGLVLQLRQKNNNKKKKITWVLS